MSQSALRRAAAFFVADLDLSVAGLGETARTTSSITWGWSAVDGADGYEWSLRLDGGEWSDPTATSSATVAASGLLSGSAYDLRVRAFVGELYGEYAQDGAATLIAAPANVDANAVEHDSITWGWDAVRGATSYQYRYKRTAISSWTTGATASPSIRIDGLMPSTAYDFEVRATGTGGTSAYTSGTATTGPAPLAVANLRATSITATRMTWRWDAVEDASSYEYQSKRAAVADWPSEVSETTFTNVPLTGLMSGTEYDFRVRAVTDAETTGWTEATASTTEIVSPASPAGLAETATTDTTITWGWNAVSSADRYEYRYQKAGGSWSSFVSVDATSVTVSSLDAGSSYTIEVRAVNTAGRSGSVSDSATTSISAPASLAESARATSSITWGWDAVSGVSTYEYQHKRTSASEWSDAVETTSRSIAISGLSSSTSYDFRVRAKGGSVNSSYSTDSATTEAPPKTRTPSMSLARWETSTGRGIDSVLSIIRPLGYRGGDEISIQLQVDTSSSFASPLNYSTTGRRSSDNPTYNVRTRFTDVDSSWSPVESITVYARGRARRIRSSSNTAYNESWSDWVTLNVTHTP